VRHNEKKHHGGSAPKPLVGSRTFGSRFITAANSLRAGRRVSNGVATLIASATEAVFWLFPHKYQVIAYGRL
jgi:hypothetical protein